MKQNIFVIAFPVLALAGMLVACKPENPDNNPNFNAEKNEVLAQFVLNIAAGKNADTKQTAVTVQKDNGFRGIQDVSIMAYATDKGYVTPASYSETPANNKFKTQFDLGVIMGSGELDGSTNQDSKSNRVVQLSIPLETDAVLFYGRAVNENPGGGTGASKKYIVDPDPSKTEFFAQRRIGDEDNVALYDATGRLMIFIVNRIGTTSVGAADSYTWTDPTNSANKRNFTDLPAISCAELAIQYQINNGLYGHPTSGETVKALKPLEEIIGRVTTEIVHIKPGEYRAGSSSAIKVMMKQIFNAISAVQDAEPTSVQEANAVRLAAAVIDRMNEYYNNNWTYKTVTDIKKVITEKNLITFDWDDPTQGFKGVTDLNNYPGSFHIPDGAAQLTFENGLFKYLNPNKPLVNLSMESFDPRYYLYPVELFYYVNSPLRVSDKGDIAISDYPNGVTNWNNDAKWTGTIWNGTKVASNTRAVAVKRNISYGVAMLETKVEFGVDYLKDNRAAMTDNAESDRSIAKGDLDITLTGVLVGGQNPRMNWQFLRKDQSGTLTEDNFPLFNGVVYDDVLASGVVPTPADKPNYTLVFDNYDSSKGAADQSSIHVALEFLNNGDDFWGRDNLIPSGCKFYLVAELENDATNQAGIVWPANTEIPPIDESTGASLKIPRIFIQDFMTSATFKLGEDSLKNAYYTMPDLRSSQMSLGLSVDLQWKNGYVYDLTF